MSTTTLTPSTATANQSFTYSTDGRLIKSVSADGVTSLWSHYPLMGGKSPDLRSLLHKDWERDTWNSVPQSATLCLQAPKMPEDLLRPVMAQFQYQTFEGVIHPVSLILYGYLKTDNAETRTPKVDTTVTMSGVIVSNLDEVNLNPEAPWTFALTAGRQYADIHCQTTVEGVVAENIATTSVTERRYWGREKVQLVTTETRVADIAASVMNVTLRSRITENPADDVELSSERRSLYSGQVQRRLQKDEQVRWQYDDLGRELRETTYANNPVNNDKSQRTDKTLTDIETRYQEVNGGTRITSINRAQANARYQRVFQDGLQRVIRVEQQRVAGANVSDSNFCPVQEGDHMLDYLPAVCSGRWVWTLSQIIPVTGSGRDRMKRNCHLQVIALRSRSLKKPWVMRAARA